MGGVCPFSTYKDSLGKPREGFHATRLPLDVAANDTLGTAAIALLVSTWYDISLWKSALGIFALGEAAHYVFGVDTAVIIALKSLGRSGHLKAASPEHQ